MMFHIGFGDVTQSQKAYPGKCAERFEDVEHQGGEDQGHLPHLEHVQDQHEPSDC